ncbi:MAG TPA: amino acid permease, partial [Bacteroidota bacterium]|nr:amino acid permease [Bacteroidota bacterium]
MTNQQPTELPRKLTLLDSTMINIGTMIGSGIFIVPATIALALHASSLIVFVWVFAGIVSLFGALSVAELGAAMPNAGGIYVYLNEAFGKLWGFLYGWAAVAVINTAAIAAIAVAFARYLGFFMPLSDTEIVTIAVGSIVVLTVINCLGIKLGAAVQNFFTIAKMAAIAALTLLPLFVHGGSFANMKPLFPSENLCSLSGPLGIALIAVLWAYDGWIEITYVAGEVIDPERNISRSIIYSTLAVIVLYSAINISLVYVLSLPVMANSSLVASDAATALIGYVGAAGIAVAVLFSTFGSNNGVILTSPRISYAMARDRIFFKSMAKVHPKFETPVVALIVQGVWASALALSGTYDQLATYVVFVSWLFYTMAVI